jgi:hypothetical protein
MSVKVSYELCSIKVRGMEIRCPLCHTVVRSGQSHRCERKKPKGKETRIRLSLTT